MYRDRNDISVTCETNEMMNYRQIDNLSLSHRDDDYDSFRAKRLLQYDSSIRSSICRQIRPCRYSSYILSH